MQATMVNAVGAVTTGNVVARRGAVPRTTTVCRTPSFGASLRMPGAMGLSGSRSASSVKVSAASANLTSFAATSAFSDAVAASVVRKSHAARTVVKCNASAAAAEEG